MRKWLITASISVLQAKLDTYANSVDPDETAHYEPSHQDLHYLPFFFYFWLTSLFAIVDTTEFRELINSRWKVSCRTVSLFSV